MRAVCLLAGAAALALAAGCRDPTEITLEIRSEVRGEVGVQAGAPGDALRAPATVVGDFLSGTLVLVPSHGKSDRVTVDVNLAVNGRAEDCAANGGPACIVGRRTLGYLPHQDLRVPIVLRADCLGISCPESETCFHRNCAPSELAVGCLDLEVCGATASDGGVDAPAGDAGGPEPLVVGEVDITAIAVRKGQLVWITRGGHVGSLDLSTRARVVRVDDPAFQPTSLTIGSDGTVCVGSDITPELRCYDPSWHLNFAPELSYKAFDLAFTGNDLWVSESAQVTQLDPTTAVVRSTHPATTAAELGSNDQNACWIRSGGISCINLASGPHAAEVPANLVALNATEVVYWSQRAIYTAATDFSNNRSVVAAGAAWALVASDADAYWLDSADSTIYRASLDPRTPLPTPLARARTDQSGASRLIHVMALDDTYLYFAEVAKGLIERVPR